VCPVYLAKMYIVLFVNLITNFSYFTAVDFRLSLKTAHFLGITFSFMQAMFFFCLAAIFYFGAWLVAYDGLAYDAMFK
jgi:hypothetical protein